MCRTPYPRRCWIRIEDARLHERRVSIRNDQNEAVFLRRVVLDLDEPTRDGDTPLAVLTNLPAQTGTSVVGRLYRRRWTIETAFQELACALQSAIDTLCYPRAALFAFSCVVVAYNLLGVVKGAVRAVHGQAKAEELSGYYLADEIAGTRRGMLIAIPEEAWDIFQGCPRHNSPRSCVCWPARSVWRPFVAAAAVPRRLPSNEPRTKITRSRSRPKPHFVRSVEVRTSLAVLG